MLRTLSCRMFAEPRLRLPSSWGRRILSLFGRIVTYRGASTILLLLFVIVAWADTPSLPSDDASLIRSLLERYRTSWLSNDADGVRSCFTPNSVLLPHHGLEPIVGMKAINDFWFAPSDTKTTVLKFVRTIDEVGIDGTLAYVRGHSELAWRVEDKGTLAFWRTGGSYMAILRKQADGKWLISHLIWDDQPNERTKQYDR
jgi:uncharacterized protein (TIGR02246 family)